MSSKILNFSKKVIAIAVILILCSSSAAHAFSFGGNKTGQNTGMISSLISRFFNSKSYGLEDLDMDLSKMKESGNIDLSKIMELIQKLPNGIDKDILKHIIELFLKNR